MPRTLAIVAIVVSVVWGGFVFADAWQVYSGGTKVVVDSARDNCMVRYKDVDRCYREADETERSIKSGFDWTTVAMTAALPLIALWIVVVVIGRVMMGRRRKQGA